MNPELLLGAFALGAVLGMLATLLWRSQREQRLRLEAELLES